LISYGIFLLLGYLIVSYQFAGVEESGIPIASAFLVAGVFSKLY